MVILTTYTGVIHVSPVFQRLSGGCGALSPLDGFPSTTGISRSKLRQGNRTRCCSDDMRPGLPGNVFRVHATTHGGNGRGRTSDLYQGTALPTELHHHNIGAQRCKDADGRRSCLVVLSRALPGIRSSIHWTVLLLSAIQLAYPGEESLLHWTIPPC